jgi:DNA-binding NtrC family response regulator
MPMAVDPADSNDDDESGAELDSGSGSRTRIRAVTAATPTSEHDDGTNLITALLAAQQQELRHLARRLKFAREKSFAASWLESCAASPHLAREDGAYALPIQRAATPLLESLETSRLPLTELHASELFSDLRELSLTVASVLDVINSFECAATQSLSDSNWAPVVQSLGRFLTCAALRVFAKPDQAPSLIESSARVRPKARAGSLRSRQLIGESRSMRLFRSQLEDIARAPGSVLIVGESGTGKELVAEAIHELGDHGAQPFIPINCSALPQELIESELFGHERGAFTGSRDTAPGLLRAAGSGTVFLDEITEMPPPLQPKLLRALEQRAVRPVGGVHEVPIHARIVAATNVDTELGSKFSSLRPDLYYRLCVHRVDVPPLRERLEDIPLLVEHFLREAAKHGHRTPVAFSSSSLEILARQRWSGNVRELRNAVEHSCAMCKDSVVEPRHLPQRLTGSAAHAANLAHSAPRGGAAAPEQLELRLLERRHIEHVLEMTAGNKARAARLLGVSRHQLYSKLERLGLIDVDDE